MAAGGKAKVEKVMHEYKSGKLKSGKNANALAQPARTLERRQSNVCYMWMHG